MLARKKKKSLLALAFVMLAAHSFLNGQNAFASTDAFAEPGSADNSSKQVGLLAGWNADHTLQALALMGAVVAFLVGLWQYRKTQQWKRAEWAAQELKAFLNDPQVDAALKMIDWGDREVCLFPAKEGKDRHVGVTSREVVEALQHHSKVEAFTPKEAAIRDAFDKLCDGLERFESYIKANLIVESDVAPYLSYWGVHLRPDSKNKKLVRVREFMNLYGWDGAERLLDRFQPKEQVR